MAEERKVLITDGQDFAEKAAEYQADGVTDVIFELTSLNFTKYKETNNGKELQPVIDGINKAMGLKLNVRLNMSLKEGYNDEEILDLLQLTFQHKYDIVFMPTISYDLVKGKMPSLRKVEGDFDGVEMFKYPGAIGRIGFVLN